MTWERTIEEKDNMWNVYYPDVMLDLECLGTDSNGQIISIGAFKFEMLSPDTPSTINSEIRSFYAVLDTDMQVALGRTITDSTTEWWKNQSESAREVLTAPAEDVRDVLKRFNTFCSDSKRIWGFGNMFDNVMLRSLYKDFDMWYPIHWTGDMDMRTLLWTYKTVTGKKGRPKIKHGTAHNALDDARKQVLQVQEMIKTMKDELKQ